MFITLFLLCSGNLKRSRGSHRSLSLSSASDRQVVLSMHPSFMRFSLSDG